MISDRCLSCLSICLSICLSLTLVYCGQTVGWMKIKLKNNHGGKPRSRPHCVRCGLTPPPKKGHSPQFSVYVRCGQTAGWTKMPLGAEVVLGQGDIVLDGDPPPPQKRGHSPQFLTHVYCGQTAGWIKMPFGTELGLSSGHAVLDWDPAPPPSAAWSSRFRHTRTVDLL